MRGLLLGFLALAGCGEGAGAGEDGDYVVQCSIGCDEQLQVGFDRAVQSEGEWRISASFGDETATCTLPLPTSLGDSGACDNEALTLVVEESASLRGLVISPWTEGPGEVSLAVSFEGEELYSDTFAPSYTPVAEGECGCAQIEPVTVSVPEPD